MMSVPPLVPPPPIMQREKQPDVSNRIYWIVAAAVFMGALLAIIVLPWLALISNIGDESNRSENGETRNVTASLDAGDASSISAAETIASTSDHAEKAMEQDETRNSVEGSDDPKSQISSAESHDGDGTDALGEPEQAKLSIVQERRTVGTPTRSGSISQSLDDLGKANPFVGSGPPAKSTVYVIDVSGSMQTPDRLPRVISTLKRALELLEPDQKFIVVLFDENYHLHPIEKGLLSANTRNKKTICDWLDRGINGSGTNPLPAMLFAVQQRPERIVLLSDGEFDPTSDVVITHANQSRPKAAIIDCVGLKEEVETLKAIARSNKGNYYQAH